MKIVSSLPRAALAVMTLSVSQPSLTQTTDTVDAAISITQLPPANLYPGASGRFEFEFTNLGPAEVSVINVNADFGLEGEIPLTLYDANRGITLPEKRANCTVSQGIANPTPFLGYSLRAGRLRTPYEPGETRVCTVVFEIWDNAPPGTYSATFVTRVNPGSYNDPNESNNQAVISWGIAPDRESAFAIPTLGPLGLIILFIFIAFTALTRFVPENRKRR